MNLCNYKEIVELLNRYNFHFSKSKGQNFLTESWVPTDIADCSGITKDSFVIEVGPGIGTLTEHLAEKASSVLSIELDPSLFPILKETLAAHSNITIIHDDIMKTDLADIALKYSNGHKIYFCSNLPYNITTPVIQKILESHLFKNITVMIQKEVADRICAKPASKEYGAFSVLCQYYAKCEKQFNVPASCFIPAPKVTSTVISLTPYEKNPFEVTDESYFFRTVQAAFALRRKTLSNSLSSRFQEFSKEQILSAIESSRLSPLIRGEALSIQDFKTLSDNLKKL